MEDSTALDNLNRDQLLALIVSASVRLNGLVAAPTPAASAVPAAPGTFLTAKQLQERLHISRATLFRLRERPGFPVADYRLGPRSPRWAEAEIATWEKR